MLKMWNMWLRYKTKNLTRIPLFIMFFDYQKYKKNGAQGSCDWYSHPNIMKDEYIRERMQECVDHIRESYRNKGLIWERITG